MKTITVGTKNADIVGSDHTEIQSAIDQLAAQGGGTVRVLPGTYTCYDAIRLRSNIILEGDKKETILKAGPTPSSPLAEDADIGEKQITPKCIDGFKPGMGVILRDRTKPHTLAPMPLTISRIENGTLFLTDWITHDWIAEESGCVVAYTPLIHGFEVSHVAVDGFTLDGARPDATPDLDGLRGGNLYLRRSNDVRISNLISRNAYGDGIRFGQCQQVVVEDCEICNNGFYGIHPGSHSGAVRFSRLNIHHNASDGLYICWGVRHSVFEECKIHHNGQRFHRSGISIGHKDTDNLFTGNHIYENCKYGVAFRKKTEANGAHRNTLRNNRIENNGSRPEEIPAASLTQLSEEERAGCGVDIQGITHDLTFENNVICETRSGASRTQQYGIRIAKDVSAVRLENNQIFGHPLGDITGLHTA